MEIGHGTFSGIDNATPGRGPAEGAQQPGPESGIDFSPTYRAGVAP